MRAKPLLALALISVPGPLLAGTLQPSASEELLRAVRKKLTESGPNDEVVKVLVEDVRGSIAFDDWIEEESPKSST